MTEAQLEQNDSPTGASRSLTRKQRRATSRTRRRAPGEAAVDESRERRLRGVHQRRTRPAQIPGWLVAPATAAGLVMAVTVGWSTGVGFGSGVLAWGGSAVVGVGLLVGTVAALWAGWTAAVDGGG